MIPVKSMTEEEMNSVAEAFADYAYEENERGLVYLFPDRERLITYLKVLLQVSLKADMVYTGSPNREGFIIITDTTNPMPAKLMLKMFAGMVKALGLGGFLNFTKHCQSGGGSIEMKLRKAKKDFIQIEMLAVKKQYQGQGHMRPLIGNAFALADQRGLPCIVVTDAEQKKNKYAHLGMKLINTRKVDEGAYLYDLIREP